MRKWFVTMLQIDGTSGNLMKICVTIELQGGRLQMKIWIISDSTARFKVLFQDYCKSVAKYGDIS